MSNDDDDNTIPNSGNPEPMKLLKIGKTFETVNEPFFERAEFWKSLNIYPERDYYWHLRLFVKYSLYSIIVKFYNKMSEKTVQ